MQLDDDDILWDVVDEHLREAEFLVELREAAIVAPHYTLAEVEEGPEERLLAHVDALVVGGPLVAEHLLISTIEDEDEEYEKIVGATLALLQGGEHLRQRVLDVLDHAKEPEQRRGVTQGLRLCSDPWIDDWLVSTLSSATGPGLAARIEALAGRSYAAGGWLRSFLSGDDLELLRAAAWLARFSPDPAVLTALAPLAQADDAELRRRTVESALCRQLPGAWESAVYWAFCPGESPFRRDALAWVATLGGEAANERVLALVEQPEHRADALWAVGFGGRASSVSRCVGLLENEDTGPLAGEVICAIAGLSGEDDRYWRQRSDEDEERALPELGDDDLDEDLVPGAEAALPVPNSEAIAEWWQERRAEFEPGVRYLGGRAMNRNVVFEALSEASMRRRHMLALELAIRTGGESFVNTRTLGRIQRAQLAALRELGNVELQRGLPLR